MEELDGAVFWSYVHEDNRTDSGQVVELAQRLTAEYSLITGRKLRLFVDRDIAWGDEWRRRIDEALVETTFFVPIITPRYFTRPECCNELTTFHAKAEGAGVGELLMPILYANVHNFTRENPDELIALVSKYQYADWTAVRLEDPHSATYRKAVHDLAQRLAGVAERTTEKQVQVEVLAVDSGANEGGLFEIAEEINARMPEWLESMEAGWTTVGQMDAVAKVFLPRLAKLQKQNMPASARLALLQRYAKELLPLAERYKTEAMVYDNVRLELAPMVERAFSLLESHPESADLFDPFWKGLKEAQIGIADWHAKGGFNLAAEWEQYQHLSQLIRQLILVARQARRKALECNDAVERWIARHRQIEGLR